MNNKKLLIILMTCTALLTSCTSSANQEESSKEITTSNEQIEQTSHPKEEKYYTISFDVGEGEGEVPSFKVKEGEWIKIPEQIPTIKHGELSYWSLYNGSVRVDAYQEYKDGELVRWSDEYFGWDGGPYIACSDLVFKANYSMEDKIIKLGECFGPGRNSLINNWDFSNKLSASLPSDDYYTSVNWSANYGFQYQYLIQQLVWDSIDIIGYSYYVLNEASDNETVINDLNELNDHHFDEYCYEITDQDYIDFVNKNYNDVQKGYAFKDNKLIGIPLLVEDWYLSNYIDGVEETIPGKRYSFVSLLNQKDWSKFNDRYNACLEVMKNLAESFLI